MLYAIRLVDNFETECQSIVFNKKKMMINEGTFSYTYLNVAYLNNIVGLILYSLYKGCVPVININIDQKDNYNNWDWYFDQPAIVMGQEKPIKLDEFESIICDIKQSPFQPVFECAFETDSIEYKIWSFIYKKFLSFNKYTYEYIQSELNMINGIKSIGCLLRGTDYIKLKPKGHPAQPDIEEVLNHIENLIKTNEYDCIYVATEEYRYFEIVRQRFNSIKVIQNKRTYYDAAYYENNIELIGNVHFDRDNDNYLKGLEYLSSITILAKCDYLLGGNCGGMLYAILMRSNPDIDTYVFNKGRY